MLGHLHVTCKSLEMLNRPVPLQVRDGEHHVDQGGQYLSDWGYSSWGWSYLQTPLQHTLILEGEKKLVGADPIYKRPFNLLWFWRVRKIEKCFFNRMTMGARRYLRPDNTQACWRSFIDLGCLIVGEGWKGSCSSHCLTLRLASLFNTLPPLPMAPRQWIWRQNSVARLWQLVGKGTQECRHIHTDHYCTPHIHIHIIYI